MDDAKLNELLDHQRWLLNNGLADDRMKDDLFLYGTLIHKDVKAVELAIDADKKKISYNVYITKTLKAKLDSYEKLKNAEGLLDLWKLNRLLKKEGNLNLHHSLNSFVKDRCGSKWSADLKIADFATYEEGFRELKDEAGPPIVADHKQSD